MSPGFVRRRLGVVIGSRPWKRLGWRLLSPIRRPRSREQADRPRGRGITGIAILLGLATSATAEFSTQSTPSGHPTRYPPLTMVGRGHVREPNRSQPAPPRSIQRSRIVGRPGKLDQFRMSFDTDSFLIRKIGGARGCRGAPEVANRPRSWRGSPPTRSATALRHERSHLARGEPKGNLRTCFSWPPWSGRIQIPDPQPPTV